MNVEVRSAPQPTSKLYRTPVNLFEHNGNNFLSLLNKTHEPQINKTGLILKDLIATLNDIKATALQKYEKNGNDFQEGYFTVVEAIERVHLIFENIKSIPIVRNKESENQLRDGSHIYTTEKIVLQGARDKKNFDHIGFLIRTDPTSEGQARSKMRINYKEITIPRIVEVRIDQDKYGANEFDFFIANPDTNDRRDNIIDNLNFKDAGQKRGHHFKSNIVLGEVPAREIHKTIDQALNIRAERTLRNKINRHDKYTGFKRK